MKPRTPTRLAWGLWGLTLVILLATLALAVLNRADPGGDARAQLVTSIVIVAYLSVGAFLVGRGQNAIGWILLAVAFASAFGFFAEQYTLRGLITAPGSLPFPRVMAWLQIPGPVAFTAFILLFLVFPDGQPPSPRWRPVLWLWGLGLALTGIGLFLRPGPLETRFGGDLRNPIGLEALEVPLEIARWLGTLFLGLAALASVASLIARFLRARGDERQQVKWVAYIAATATVFLIAMIVSDTEPDRAITDALFIVFISTLVVGLPIALSVAILKYRLYDIDLVINKTLVYGSLTALLAGIYVGAVVGLGALVRAVTDQRSNSLVIAASTLAVAALFVPARRRIQGFIDRRFYRRKYNAARTLEAFSARLREQVDLDSLTGELVGVVRSTMQPVHVSLWLRGGQQGLVGGTRRYDERYVALDSSTETELTPPSRTREKT
jgi:hypothetical protein